MTYDVIATGATVDEARANAIAKLNAPSDADVKIDILEMPKKKTFGLFGGSPAKVKASYEGKDKPKAPVAPKAKSEAKAEVPAKKVEKKAEKVEKKAPKAEKKAPKAAPTPVVEAEKAEEPAQVAVEEKTEIDINSSEVAKVAAEYLKTVLTGMGIQDFSATAYSIAKTNEIVIHINCTDDYGILIGRRGETLDSLQFLTRLAAKKSNAEGDYTRVSVNIGNYREKRNVTLKELAQKNANKVLKYGRNMTFEPMNPYERRVIHTTVQEIEGVTSFSVGSDAARKVVIALEDGVKPTHAKGGYNKGGYKGNNPRNNNRRPYNNNNSRPRYNNSRPNNNVESAPTREPRTDASAEKVARYGKIN